MTNRLIKSMILAFICIAILFQCDEKENDLAKLPRSVSFNVSLDNPYTGRLSSGDSLPDAVFISIRNLETGKLAYSLKKLMLVAFGGGYITQEIDLLEGSHSVEDFLVVNASEETIYLTPKEGSELADFVSDPLPLEFEVSTEDTSTVTLEVIPADLGEPLAYGYSNFTFDVLSTYTVQPNALEGMDAHIINRPDYIDQNFGLHPGFRSMAWTLGGVPFTGRSLIKFDLDTIPIGSEVRQARLYMYGVNIPYIHPGHSKLSGSNAFELLKVTSTWDESTVTWNTQPTTTEDEKILLPESDSIYQNYQIDVTNSVQLMVNDPESNFGFMIKLSNESHYRQILFGSSDFEDPLKRPKLVVTYK